MTMSEDAMRTRDIIQKLAKLGRILSRIAFVLAVVGVCGCVAGLLSLSFGNGGVVKLGGVTLHGLISADYGYNIKSIAATLSGWLVVCAGEAVLAWSAVRYFRDELAAGTPFTLAGARELLWLGILTLALPTGCAVVGSIVEGIVAGFLAVEKASAMDLHFDNEASLVLGVMFLLGSLLCRHGAALAGESGTDA